MAAESISLEDIKTFIVDVDTNNNPNGLLNDVNFVRSSGHVKRPMNPFMVWSQYQRKMICREHPAIHNAQISKQLGQLWKNMTPEQRLPYKIEARRLADLHRATYPDYKYQPRKKTSANQAAAKNNSRFDKAIVEEITANGQNACKNTAKAGKSTKAVGRPSTGNRSRSKSGTAVATNFVTMLNTGMSSTNFTSNIYTNNKRCLDSLTLAISQGNSNFKAGSYKTTLHRSGSIFSSNARLSDFVSGDEPSAGYASPVNSDCSFGTLDTEASSAMTNCSTGSFNNKSSGFQFINVSKVNITAGVNYLINESGLLMPSTTSSPDLDELSTTNNLDGNTHLNSDGFSPSPSSSSVLDSEMNFAFSSSPMSSINTSELDLVLDNFNMSTHDTDPFMALDQLDVGNSEADSHFEFPDFDEPEVMNIFFSNEMK